jgi:hypothetical protein
VPVTHRKFGEITEAVRLRRTRSPPSPISEYVSGDNPDNDKRADFRRRRKFAFHVCFSFQRESNGRSLNLNVSRMARLFDAMISQDLPPNSDVLQFLPIISIHPPLAAPGAILFEQERFHKMEYNVRTLHHREVESLG